jgi:hypothetical protein
MARMMSASWSAVRSTLLAGATIRPSSDSGRPIQKSSPSGAAISSAKTVPRLRPDTRRTTSPTSEP